MRPFVVLSMRQVASAISTAIGKTVTYVPMTAEAARQSMAQIGMDDWMVNVRCDDFAAPSDNWGDVITDDFSLVTGKAPRTIEQLPKTLLALLGNNSHGMTGARFTLTVRAGKLVRLVDVPTARFVGRAGFSP